LKKEFKKSLLLLFVALIFMSCEKVQVSSMTLQANIDADFFRAYSVSTKANSTEQMIHMAGRGGTTTEKLELHFEWRGANVYRVGEGEVNYAVYRSANDSLYTTRSPGSFGTITVTNQDEGGQELAGEFNFTFISATDTLSISRGVFYVVPYEITE
jgi:hypothetical protein